MEDSSMMTVEFLRARLLSERSVSKTARDRAEELAKRVVELEEQLKFATLQRKNAEKAAEEVLSILKSNGISDFSDEYDSSSDQERTTFESKVDNSVKEDKRFSTLKPRRKEKKELRGWDSQSVHSTDKSLSWESCTGSSDSLEKKKHNTHARRRQRFISVGGSSVKQPLGKSCHPIKQRETRSALAEIRGDSLLQESGTATGFGYISNDNNRPEILKEGSKGKDFVDVDMKKALEDQALLIGRYEEEENAQREWEEKFRENNGCTVDSCEPGNRSDMTEERETCTDTLQPVSATLSHGKGAMSELEDVRHNTEEITKALPSDFIPTSKLDNGCLTDQQSNCLNSIGNGSETGYPEFSFPHHQEYTEAKANGKLESDWPEKNSSNPTSCGSSEHQLGQTYPTFNASGSSSYKGGSTGSQNELQLATHLEATSGLGDVLESLRRAKLSLNREISRLPSTSQRRQTDSARENSIHGIKAADVMEIPVECNGLFRLPTVFQPEHYTIRTPRLWDLHGEDSRTDLLRR